jgi:broad specificity phosphatase PhoE
MRSLEQLSKPEQNIEREKFEKIVVLIRHPSTAINKLLDKGEDDTSWDDIENDVWIEKGRGNDMAKELVDHLINEVPELIKTSQGLRDYKVWTSPLRRTAALAKFDLLHLKNAHEQNSEIPLPINNTPEIIDNFKEIPMAYSKGEILGMLDKTIKEGKPALAVMEEWFTLNPEFIASVFEKERQRVIDGLEKIKNEKTPINLIHTHRLVTGFTLWLIEDNNMNQKITVNDLPAIMEISRNIPYVSESEIGWDGNSWIILRKGDTSYLNKDLIGGTF